MIWESVPLMTLFDLLFVALAIIGAVLLARVRRRPWFVGAGWGPTIIGLGLAIFGLFYMADLLLMHALPALVETSTATVIMRNIHLNYSWVVFFVSASCVLAGLAATNRTIARSFAEREDAHARLGASEQRYRDLVQDSQGLICVHDLHGTLLALNPAAARSLGYEPSEEAIGRNLAEFLAPDVRSKFPAYLTRIKEQGSDDGLFQMVTKTGVERTWAYRNVLHERSGQEPYVLGHALDITERERAGEVLRKSESRTRLLKEVAVAANEAKGADEALLVALERVCDFTKWPVGHVYVPARDGTKDLDPTKLWHLDAPERFGVFKEVTERTRFAPGIGLPGRVLATGQPAWIVDVTKDPNFPRAKLAKNIGVRGGFGFPVLVEKEVLAVLEFFSAEAETPDEALLEVMAQIGVQLGVVMDRKRSEESLRRSEQQYRDLVEHATYGIYRSSREGRFESANPALIEMLGYESEDELLGAGLAMDVYAELRQRGLLIGEHRETERIEGLEVEWKQKDGTPMTVRLSGRAVRNDEGELQCFEMIAEDVTDRRTLEAQLRQSQKMEAVGRLAGGVAHDFNNLLTVIVGESEMALADLPEDAPVREGLDEIRQAADRAAGLTRQLLTFSRRQIIEPTVFSLKDLVRDTDKMLGRLIGEDIELVTRTEPDLGSVEADRGQMEQVVMNLVVNARDAMPKGGKLVIETANVTLDEEYAASHADVKAGDYVALSVSDSGTGMTEKTMAHLFEPFFTTKEKGLGTGLGLATSYGIVKQSGGHIGAYSEVGIGTTMKAYLPRVAAPAGDDAGPEAAELPRGTETVLLVEDEERVRAVGKRILEGQGYTVLEAADGEKALRLIENHTGSLHLLLTDVVLPKMDGRLLAERVKELLPDVKVLFASGYTEDVVLKHRLLTHEVALLQKPFTMESLLSKVREVLDAGAEHERS